MATVRASRWWWVVLALMAVAFVAALAVRHEVFPYSTGDNDEPVLRYQAEMLRDREVTIPRTQEQFFRPWLTGPHGDRLVPPFQPLWPALLLASDVLTGSMVFALGIVAAGLVLATFLLARELLANDARAALATVLVAGAPFVLMLSGTYLMYLLATALGTGLTAAALRGLRTGSRAALLTAGVLGGLLVLTRPFDAVLWCLPVAGFAVLVHRHALRQLLAPVGWFVVGAVPLLGLALAYNAALTGSITTFGTTVQSQGTAVLGWGIRSIAPDTPILDFTPTKALESLRDNLAAMPTWLVGTYLALVVVAYGAFRLWRQHRDRLALLVAMTFVFPIAYVAWFTTALTVGGATDGIGPHYYLPMVVPLGVLAAHGIAEGWDRLRAPRVHGRALLAVAGVGALVLTVVAVVPKLDSKRAFADGGRADVRVVDRVRDRSPEPTLFIQERRWSPYVMEPYPYFANDPALRNDALFALDRGAAGIDLLDRYRDRHIYRLVRQLEPGDPLTHLPLVAVPQAVVRGETVVLRTHITNDSDALRVTAYLRWRSHRAAFLLDTGSVKGRTYDVTWTISPSGIRYAGPPARGRTGPPAAPGTFPRGAPPDPSRALKGTTPPPPEQLVVGVALDRSRNELHYYGRVARGGARRSVEVLTAPAPWTYLPAPFDAWLPLDVRKTVRVDISPGR